MKALEFQSKTDKKGHLKVDYKINQPEKNVRVIVLFNDEDIDIENDEKWIKAISDNPSYDFLNEPEEDIYTLKDGEPIDD
ncbi:MAG: hypothetical protein JXR50_08170 [Prolixibacteraceae bacterium]|nr:hypothetical protein [Prolixibacteraceae bacterium]MBN2649699.1 hypothetical protein [Prolixibacteraceae bacterium]